ncbi:hypothetical protein GCM10010129_80090 [Streptomyces fumigatiscleroticus]|nr:hypothetical protein GCM10010129_80090 [Streptomyces fumigatiscleroticus]
MDNETDRPRPAAGASGTARVPRATRRTRTAVLSTVLLAAGLALTACGGGSGGSGNDSGQKASDSGVASLTTPSSGGGKAGAAPAAFARSSSSAAEAKRPQLRLDSSQEEIDQLWDAYWACLQTHGVPMNTMRVDRPGEQAPPVDDPKVADRYKAQYHACLYKLPLQPVEERPETNPHYADDYRAYVGCLKATGLKIHEVFDSDGSPAGWSYDEDFPKDSVDLPTDKVDNDCRLEAFGGKGKN